MCGRFTNRYSWRELHELYRATEPWIGPASNLEPRYNIAPMQRVVALRLQDGGIHPFVAQWSLMSFWPKDGKWKLSTFNAKIERLIERRPGKPGVFDRAWDRGQRCLVPANGFYEWPIPKHPRYFARNDDAPFAFAGLWDHCRKPDGTELVSVTIITCPPNTYMEPYHDRMPVMLTPEQFERWLSCTPSEATKMCVAYRGDDLVSWPVDPAVGNVRNEGPTLCQSL